MCIKIVLRVDILMSEKPEWHTYALYSAQRNAEVGRGQMTKRIRKEPGWEEELKRIKAEQAAENEAYRTKKKNGEAVPIKFPRRVILGVPVDAVKELAPEEQVQEGDNIGAKPIRKKKPQVVLTQGTVLQPVIPNPERREHQASRLAAEISPEEVNRQRTSFHLKLTPHTGNTLYVLGSSKRGKSTAIMKIYDDYFGGPERNYVSILWSVNPQTPAYKGHSKLIKASWDRHGTPQVIKIEQQIQRKTNNEYKFLNIFDDVLHVKGDETMENLIMTYRNSKISSIVAMQYTNQLQKNCRANVNGVLLFGFNTDEAIEVVIKCFLRGYLHSLGMRQMPDMINWYKRVTDDHGFIYHIPEDGTVTLHKFRM